MLPLPLGTDTVTDAAPGMVNTTVYTLLDTATTEPALHPVTLKSDDDTPVTAVANVAVAVTSTRLVESPDSRPSLSDTVTAGAYTRPMVLLTLLAGSMEPLLSVMEHDTAAADPNCNTAVWVLASTAA